MMTPCVASHASLAYFHKNTFERPRPPWLVLLTQMEQKSSDSGMGDPVDPRTGWHGENEAPKLVGMGKRDPKARWHGRSSRPQNSMAWELEHTLELQENINAVVYGSQSRKKGYI